MKIASEIRLDSYLVENGLVSSRDKAKEAIVSGAVAVNGVVAKKPSVKLKAGEEVVCTLERDPWVSRAAYKLLHGLETFSISVEGRCCLDLGASTGGFCQVLLEKGAARVVGVDVGHGQLAQDLQSVQNLTYLDGLNVKDLTFDHIGFAPEVITSDLSFISLKKALPAALALRAETAVLVALIKPQFEVGKGNIGKGGLVKDQAAVEAVLEDIPAWLTKDYGARILGVVPSPIKGGDGNQEYLMAAELNG